MIAVDLLDVDKVRKVFDRQLQESNDTAISVSDVVSVVGNLVQHLPETDSELNVFLASDLIVNWLLNVFDK